MSENVCVGNPQKHKATVCDTRGQCSLVISIVGQKHKPEKCITVKSFFLKKDHSFEKQSLEGNLLRCTINFGAFHDLQVLVTVLFCFFFKLGLSFRVNLMCKCTNAADVQCQGKLLKI